MAHDIPKDLQELLTKASKAVDDLGKQGNPRITGLAQAWAAYLAEYVHSSVEYWSALKRQEMEEASKHRLNAICHNARAGRKHKELQLAIAQLRENQNETESE